MARAPEIADDGAGSGGFDLSAASLRASSVDLSTSLEVLAGALEQALPGRVRVERRAVRRFSRVKRVQRLEVRLGDNLFIAVFEAGVLEARRAVSVRGIVLKSEALTIDAWLRALGVDLAAEADVSEQSRRALEQLLGG